MTPAAIFHSCSTKDSSCQREKLYEVNKSWATLSTSHCFHLLSCMSLCPPTHSSLCPQRLLSTPCVLPHFPLHVPQRLLSTPYVLPHFPLHIPQRLLSTPYVLPHFPLHVPQRLLSTPYVLPHFPPHIPCAPGLHSPLTTSSHTLLLTSPVLPDITVPSLCPHILSPQSLCPPNLYSPFTMCSWILIPIPNVFRDFTPPFVMSSQNSPSLPMSSCYWADLFLPTPAQRLSEAEHIRDKTVVVNNKTAAPGF